MTTAQKQPSGDFSSSVGLGPLPEPDVTALSDYFLSDGSRQSLAYTADQLEAYAARAVDAASARWRGIAQRVATDANRYGCEGLRMRCTISASGCVVSWEVDRA